MALDALVRTAIQQIDYLELLLLTDLPTDRQTVYDALLTLEQWRRAARTPAVLITRHQQAINELARATVQARALLDELEKACPSDPQPFHHDPQPGH